MENLIKCFSIFIQCLIGFNLVLPFFFLLAWIIKKKPNRSIGKHRLFDFAIIVTAYQHTSMLHSVVNSILKSKYANYHIYVVTDNCEENPFEFVHPNVSVLVPDHILSSNTLSHQFATNHFKRNHDIITIIDSDNLVDENYLNQINHEFLKGFSAVQGIRKAKNLNTTIACLDAARDLYYHFYDGKVLFEIGSSATLAGSGMAFKTSIYQRFLDTTNISGAGFDKVLQSFLVLNNYRISFSSNAIVYDEKTSKADQLVQQRSRWLNSWFKYAALGFNILKKGIQKLNINQILFGIVLLRPPLFIFLALSIIALVLNLALGFYIVAIIWAVGLLLFVLSFYLSLNVGKADSRIIKSLINIPQFVYYQFLSLLKVGKANKISISTRHYSNESDSE